MPNQLAQNHPRDRAPFIRASILGIFAVSGLVLETIGVHYGFFLRLGISDSISSYAIGIAVGVLIAAALVSLLKANYRRDGHAPENRIDRFQTQQRRILIAIALLITGFGGMAIFHPLHHGRAVDVDFSIEFALLSIAMAGVAAFGVGFLRRSCRIAANDEFVQALRARATQIGYLLAMTGLSAAYMLCIFRPDLTIIALPVALLIGVLAPTSYFLIAERRANSDG